MRIGVLTRNEDAWCSSRLKEAILKMGHMPVCFFFSDLTVRIGMDPPFSLGERDLIHELDALIVRPIGRGSLDEIIFRLDILQRMVRLGLPVVNHPSAIERAVDKYNALALLSEAEIAVPRTVVTENIVEALKAFYGFGGEAIVKPIFGSRGIGVARISDPDVAERSLRTLRFDRHVLYVQEFVPHGVRDIRTFVVGDRVVAAMYRVSDSWKTNIRWGASAMPLRVNGELEKLALKVAKIIGCEIAGIDVMEGKDGYIVNEINSQPGWRALQTTTKVDIASPFYWRWRA